MSNTTKWLVGMVIALVVAGGIWWWSVAAHPGAGSPAAGTYGTTTDQTGSPTAANTGNADQSVDQDLTSIDAQMNGFSSDSASINQGLNDQPVQQEQL